MPIGSVHSRITLQISIRKRQRQRTPVNSLAAQGTFMAPLQ